MTNVIHDDQCGGGDRCGTAVRGRSAGGLGDVEAQAEPGTIEKTHVWTVRLLERHLGANAWMEIDWKPAFYFVDEVTGLVIGFATE